MAAHEETRGSTNYTWSVVENIIENSHCSKDTLNYLLQNVLIFDNRKEAIKDAISWINNNLTGVINKSAVFLILDTVCEQSSTQQFTENCLTWINQLKRYLHSRHDNAYNNRCCCHTLTHLLKTASQLPELHREIATTHLTHIVNDSLKLNLTDAESLRCLTELLHVAVTHYPASCPPTLKKQIQAHLIDNYIDADHVPQSVFECLSGLCWCGPATSHVTNWQNSTAALITTLNTLTGDLTANTQLPPLQLDTMDAGDGEEAQKVDVSVLQLPDRWRGGQEPPLCRYSDVARRVVWLCRWLRHMLCGAAAVPSRTASRHAPAAVTVPVDRILALTSQILTINVSTLSKHGDSDSAMFLLMLPRLQQGAVAIIEGLVLGIGSNLLEYSAEINRIYVECLITNITYIRHMSSGGIISTSSSSSALHDSVVSILTHMLTWVTVMPDVMNSLEKHLHPLITDALLPAVTGDRRTSQQQIGNPAAAVTTPHYSSSNSSKRKGRGKKRKFSTPTEVATRGHDLYTVHVKHGQRGGTDVMCLAALKLLQAVIIKCGDVIGTKTWKMIHGCVIHQLLSAAVTSSNQQALDDKCRLHVYKLLYTCLIKYNPVYTLPPLQPAIHCFTRGLQDTNVKISRLCAEYLCVCDVITSARVAPKPAPPAPNVTHSDISDTTTAWRLTPPHDPTHCRQGEHAPDTSDRGVQTECNVTASGEEGTTTLTCTTRDRGDSEQTGGTAGTTLTDAMGTGKIMLPDRMGTGKNVPDAMETGNNAPETMVFGDSTADSTEIVSSHAANKVGSEDVGRESRVGQREMADVGRGSEGGGGDAVVVENKNVSRSDGEEVVELSDESNNSKPTRAEGDSSTQDRATIQNMLSAFVDTAGPDAE